MIRFTSKIVSSLDYIWVNWRRVGGKKKGKTKEKYTLAFGKQICEVVKWLLSGAMPTRVYVRFLWQNNSLGMAD